MLKSFRGILLIPFFIFTLTIQAQVSPYTRFGVGDLIGSDYARAKAIGGATLALPDGINLNPANPASYALLELTTFETGLEATMLEQTQLTPEEISISNNRAGIRYFSFGVPLTKYWGSALSLQPYSLRGYNITSQRTFDGINITDNFKGSGSLNQITWGNGFNVAKGFNIGFNASYIFGSFDEQNSILFDTLEAVDTRIFSNEAIHGFHFKYALLYNYEFKNNHIVGIGLTYTNKTNLNSTFSKRIFTTNAATVVLDTLAGSVENNAGDFILPSELAFGISYGKKDDNGINNAWLVSLDYEIYNGQEFNSQMLSNRNAVAGSRIQAGASLIPSITFEKLKRSSAYLSHIEYRVGGFYNKQPININNTALYDYGITFGFGFPVNHYRNAAPGEVKRSFINTGFVLGRRGTTENGLIQEDYVSLYLGLSLGDKWFIKYKYR